MPIDRETDKAAEAEKAKVSLRQGIARSKQLIGQYRSRLAMLRRGSTRAAAGDRPLFRFES